VRDKGKGQAGCRMECVLLRWFLIWVVCMVCLCACLLVMCVGVCCLTARRGS
jgi:hypothetical protein